MEDYRSMRERAVRELRAGRGGAKVSDSPLPLEPSFRRFSWQGSDSSVASYVPLPGPLTFLRVLPSLEDEANRLDAAQFLTSLPVHAPVSFELVGMDGRISFQLAIPGKAANIESALGANFPSAEIFPADDLLGEATKRSRAVSVRGFRLAETHLFELRADQRKDPYISLFGLLSALPEGTFGALQVLFVPVAQDWKSNILAVAEDPQNSGRSAFKDLPDLPKRAARKVSWPLYAVSVRLVGSTAEIADGMSSFLTQLSGENRLVGIDEPLPSRAAIARTNHTAGMLLNAHELAALAHLPADELVDNLALETAQLGAPPPNIAHGNLAVHFGQNSYRGKITEVGIPASLIPRHVAIFGATGSGKTNLLLRFAQLVDEGYGLAFLDPNGDAAEDFLRLIPKHRVDDTIYFDPSDREFPPAFNVLEASDEREREMLASDLLVAMKHLFDRWWGYRQEVLLRQCIMTLLFSQGTKTLRDIPRLLLEEDYRNEVLATVEDQDIHAFWKMQFSTLRKDAVGPVLSKVSKFVDNPIVRAIVAQPNKIDFQQIMREGKVFVANLAKGRLGEDTATLLGSMILAKLQVATMSRAALPPDERQLFVIVADEFQNYAGEGADTSSIRSFLSEARKYNVGLVAATQFISQLSKDVQTAIFGNVGTLMALRCGVFDAHVLQKELGRFTADDLMDLDVGEAIVRMGRAGDSFNVAIEEVKLPANSHRDEIVSLSRQRYCRPRQEVEAELRGQAALPEEPPDLDPDERAFLERVAAHPEESVTAVYRAIGFGANKGSRIREKLKEAGLLVEVETRLGRGGTLARFVVPTLSGFEALGQKPHSGRGGPIHRHFQRLIADYARSRGYEALVEHHVPNGSVDVHLERDGKKTAVEVSVTSSAKHELKNVDKCVASGYDQVVVLFLDEKEMEKLRKLPSNARNSGVIIGRLDRFYESFGLIENEG